MNHLFNAPVPAPLRAALIDHIGLALIVCDASGQVHFANAAAQAELAEGSMLWLEGEQLACRGDEARAQLTAALQSTGARRRRQLLALTDGRDRVMASVIPLPAHGVGAPLVMLLLGQRGPCSELGLQMLAGLHGLTPAEQRVLAALLHDRSPRDIARAVGVAISTVRSQVSSIRQKLGVRGITGLVLRAAEVPPMPNALHGSAFSMATPDTA
jgi:DNA-binding CsgD family transcriptional regulator